MSGLSADHRRIFAGFDAKVAAPRSDGGFISIGTVALHDHIRGLRAVIWLQRASCKAYMQCHA